MDLHDAYELISKTIAESLSSKTVKKPVWSDILMRMSPWHKDALHALMRIFFHTHWALCWSLVTVLQRRRTSTVQDCVAKVPIVVFFLVLQSLSSCLNTPSFLHKPHWQSLFTLRNAERNTWTIWDLSYLNLPETAAPINTVEISAMKSNLREWHYFMGLPAPQFSQHDTREEVTTYSYVCFVWVHDAFSQSDLWCNFLLFGSEAAKCFFCHLSNSHLER